MSDKKRKKVDKNRLVLDNPSTETIELEIRSQLHARHSPVSKDISVVSELSYTGNIADQFLSGNDR